MENNNNKLPKWFWGVSIFFLLWNIMGVLSFFAHTFMSVESLANLSEEERALYLEYPFWATIVFAIAVFFGFFGSIGLILRKKWSKLILIISICAIIPQMIYNLFFTKSTEVYGLAQTASMPIMVVVFGFLLIWFSTHSIHKNWLK